MKPRVADRSANPSGQPLRRWNGYARAGGEATELANRTTTLFTTLANLAEREGVPLRFALEMNRAKGIIDPSTSYKATGELCQRIDRVRVGICWDWGHGYSNVLSGKMEPDLPTAFLERVIHTHIHSVGPSGRTHWPLTHGHLPLERYAAALIGSGYGGYFTLELSPERFSSEGPLTPFFLGSIELLKKTLAKMNNG